MDIGFTRVIFRKWKKGGSVIAFFPDIKNGALVMSYERVGQHSDASYPHPDTVPTSPQEYAALQRELTQIGYNLKIITRR